MNRTTIEQFDLSTNPIQGCNINCGYCYARIKAAEFSKNCPKCKAYTPHFHPERLMDVDWFKRKKYARVFVGSMTDMWSPGVEADWRKQVFEAIMNQPNMDFFVLTKRPDQVSPFELPTTPNFYLGTTIEGSKWLSRLDWLAGITDVKRFVSFEPLAFPVVTKDNWHDVVSMIGNLSWVIVGAMTGDKAVKFQMDMNWAQDIRTVCLELGIPFFFKRNSAGGRELNGIIYEGVPEPSISQADASIFPA